MLTKQYRGNLIKISKEVDKFEPEQEKKKREKLGGEEKKINVGKKKKEKKQRSGKWAFEKKRQKKGEKLQKLKAESDGEEKEKEENLTFQDKRKILGVRENRKIRTLRHVTFSLP